MKKWITYCLLISLVQLGYAQPEHWTNGKAATFLQLGTFTTDFIQNHSLKIGDGIAIFSWSPGNPNNKRCVGYSIIKDTLKPIDLRVFLRDAYNPDGVVQGDPISLTYWRNGTTCEYPLVQKLLTAVDTTTNPTLSKGIATTVVYEVSYPGTSFTIEDSSITPYFAPELSLIFRLGGVGLYMPDTTSGVFYPMQSTPGKYPIAFISKFCLTNNQTTITITDTATPKTFGPDLSALTYSLLAPGCKNKGSMQIKSSSIKGHAPFQYTLTNVHTQDSIVSASSIIDRIPEGVYQLAVTDTAKIRSIYSATISFLNTENCHNYLLTPDNKNGLQSIYISDQGTAKILDKEGNIVKQLTIPAEWDARDASGNFVHMGDYYLFINEQQSKIITVIR